MCLRSNDVTLSLGTSDVFIATLDESDYVPPRISGPNVFVHPFQLNAYMSILCFKNGSATRDRVKAEYAGDDWKIFGQLLACSPPGNYGNIGMYSLSEYC